MANEELNSTEGYPLNKRLSAQYKGTFAYLTVRDRMPKILTQVIDGVHKEEPNMKTQHGTAGTEDVKTVLSQLGELRYQMQTDKPMVPIERGEDISLWKTVFERYRESLGESDLQWFTVSWLLAECYMYRKIMETFQKSAYMTKYDPFQTSKEGSYTTYFQQISSQASRVVALLSHDQSHDQCSEQALRADFEQLLLLCLWGNKMDLSMLATMAGYNPTLSTDSKGQSKELQSKILADHTSTLWQVVKQPKIDGKTRRIDFVLDNSGFEIFTDICFADWLLSSKLADVICFHCKVLPWFVSDAMIKDFNWIVDRLATSTDEACSKLGQRWRERVQDGSFTITDHSFWTTSYEYAAMEKIAPDLYSLLSEAHLVFFKGDLNYRKLLADRNWAYTEKFVTALGGFLPTNVCALRTLKADLVTGLPAGAASRAAAENKDWMVTGQYAVLQVAEAK